MTLFQKINKILFILWTALFCPLVFSNPSLFDPRLFSPRSLPSQVIIPQNTPIMPLCPPGVSIQLCLAFTSFPLVQTQPNKTPSPTMFTPFSHKTQDISPKRRRRFLSKYRWKSYQYSNEERQLESLSEKERSIEPEGDYYRLHIQEQPEADNLTQVIQESRVDGQQRSQVGELRGVPTEEVLSIVEEGVPPKSKKAPFTPIIPPQVAPPDSTKTETQEEVQEEPVTQKPIITTNPVIAIALNYNDFSEPCSDEDTGDTEAVSICVDCTSEANRDLEDRSFDILGKIDGSAPHSYFKSQLEKKIKGKICHGTGIQHIKDNFEETCGNISFEDYIGEVLICESCQNKIPPALMLSMLSLESDGRCPVKGDSDSSLGLFQINTKDHKHPLPCNEEEKQSIQSAELAELKKNLQCLENPVVNTKKSIEVLKGKYQAVNNSQSSFNCESPSMNAQQTDRWRKALAGYNGGQSHIKRMQKLPRPNAIPEETWKNMDEWGKIRVQYFFYQSYTDRNGNIRTVSPKVRMGNLAYVETALRSTGTAQSQLNLFKSWEKVLGNSMNLSQCR